MRGQAREVCHWNRVTVEDAANLAQLLVGQFEEFIQQSEFVHQLKGGGMNRVAAEIAKEIGMLFQHRHLNAGASEQITRHHSSRPAANDNATSSVFVVHRSDHTSVRKTAKLITIV